MPRQGFFLKICKTTSPKLVFLSVLTCLSISQVSADDLTLAVADLPFFAPVLVAEKQGYFKAEGLNLKVIHCPNGKQCLKQLTDGEANIATAADTPLVFASLDGKPFTVIATIATSSRETRLVALKEKGIQEPKDLKGKRLGVVLGTSGQYFADSFLLFHGLSPQQTTIVSLDPKNAHEALIRGDVDAAALYQPHGYLAIKALGMKAVTLPSPKFLSVSINLVVADKNRAPSHSQMVSLLRAVQRANRLISDEPAFAQKVIAESVALNESALSVIWSDYEFGLRLGQPLISAMESQARWAVRAGLVANKAVPDYLDYIDTSPLTAVSLKSVTLVK